MDASADRHRGALEALDRILNRGGDADDVLRAVISVLHGLYPYAGITFVERGERVPGPSLGARPEACETWPISFQGIAVAELETAGSTPEDRRFLERVAVVISPYCLVGWDTGGRVWEP